jgi:hypothetical protein
MQCHEHARPIELPYHLLDLWRRACAGVTNGTVRLGKYGGKLTNRWLPMPRISLWPSQRFLITQGGSRMRESRAYDSVRGRSLNAIGRAGFVSPTPGSPRCAPPGSTRPIWRRNRKSASISKRNSCAIRLICRSASSSHQSPIAKTISDISRHSARCVLAVLGDQDGNGRRCGPPEITQAASADCRSRNERRWSLGSRPPVTHQPDRCIVNRRGQFVSGADIPSCICVFTPRYWTVL